MVSFPNIRENRLVSLVGCNDKNVFHSKNRQTAVIGAGLLTGLILFNRYAAQRIGSTLNRPVQVLTAASTAAAVYLNRRSKLQTLATESAARTAFIINNDGDLDTDKVADAVALINKQLGRAYKYSRSYAFDTAADKLAETPTQEGLRAAVNNLTKAFEHFQVTTRNNAVKPGAIGKDLGSNGWARWTSEMGEGLNQAARLLLSLKNLPEQSGDTEDVNKPVALRTSAEVRQYIQGLDETDREELVGAIFDSSWAAFSTVAGDWSKKPDGIKERPGYNPNQENLTVIQGALAEAIENSSKEAFVLTYNEVAKTSQITAQFLKAPMNDKVVGSELVKDVLFALAPVAEVVTEKTGEEGAPEEAE